jgi:hypothetical protein
MDRCSNFARDSRKRNAPAARSGPGRFSLGGKRAGRRAWRQIFTVVM